jgi:hypothetical protein
MTTSVERQQGLVKLTGTITNYQCTRDSASFVFTDADRNTMGVIAIAATIAGLSGPAIATAANVTSTEEDADYVEFNLDGKPVKGWVWRSPFKEGDAVEVAAEWHVDHYEASAIARPVDRIIALYPHCSRGRARHVKNAMKWGGAFILFFLLGCELLSFGVARWSISKYMSDFLSIGHLVLSICYLCFFGLMTFSLTRKWMPFVRLTEKVCRMLGLPDPGNVDLVKSSKAQRKPDDSGEFGTFYFRY